MTRAALSRRVFLLHPADDSGGPGHARSHSAWGPRHFRQRTDEVDFRFPMAKALEGDLPAEVGFPGLGPLEVVVSSIVVTCASLR